MPDLAVEEAPREGSSSSHVVNALISPREAFTSLARRPTYALALAVLIALTATLGYLAMSKVTPSDFVKTLEASGRQMPPNALENAPRYLAIARWSQFGGALIVSPLLYLAVSGVFLVIFRMSGSEITFRQSFATTLHGLLPFAVLALIGIAVTLGKSEISLAQIQSGSLVASNLGFLAGDGAGKATTALLTSLDVFSLWCILLLALGYRIVGSLRAGTAWAGVLTVWILGVLIKVGLAAIF
jgi:hypothetical protein